MESGLTASLAVLAYVHVATSHCLFCMQVSPLTTDPMVRLHPRPRCHLQPTVWHAVGWMEQFDRDFVCNRSDNEGRYDFKVGGRSMATLGG